MCLMWQKPRPTWGGIKAGAFASEMYQRIVDNVAARENSSLTRSYGWEGHNGPACSLYPNIAAILSARRLDIFDYSPALLMQYAHFCAVLDSGEPLERWQLAALADMLHVTVDYISAPVLSVVDIRRKRDKVRVVELGVLLRYAELYGMPMTALRIRAKAHQSAAMQGRPVPFEFIRWPTEALQEDVERWEAEVVAPMLRERRMQTGQ